LLDRPRLRRNLNVATVAPDKLFISDGARQSLVEGEIAVALAPMLDGQSTSAEIIARFAHLPIGKVLGTLKRLERLDYLTDGDVVAEPAAAAHWDAARLDPTDAVRRAQAGSVGVTGIGPASTAVVTAALERAGVALDEDGTGALDVVVTEDYLAPELAAVNERQLRHGKPWLLGKLVGEELWLGPYLRPNVGACWRCLAQRLEGNRQLERYLARRSSRRVGPGVPPALASTMDTGAAMLATEVQTILAGGGSPRLDETIVTLDLHTLESARHAVVRQPTCPACGSPAPETDPRITLRPGIKRHTDVGGHRVVSPSETYARLERHISPLTGAVTSVRRQTTEDNGVAYAYAAGHNFALMQDSTFFLRKNLRGRSGGKGRTDLQAKVGAVCEAIERFNGVYRGDEPSRVSAYSALDPSVAVHPEDLLLFSEHQYAMRDRFNQHLASYHVVPERLDPDKPIHWTTAWSLTDERAREVPSAYFWYGHPDLMESFFTTTDANGSAAGNTVEEAILQGLMELVERDSVALWWYNRVRRPAVDLDAIADPYVDQVRNYYDTLGRDLWMLDLTSDLGIPAFAGVSSRRDGPVQDLLMGFGAHLDPHTAAMRALTELNQFLPAVNERNPDGTTNYWMDDPDAVQWWTTATLESEPYLLPADAPASRPEDFTQRATQDIAQDVRACVARLAELGHEVLVVDQTRPDIDLATVKVLAPGLRHFWRRLGPGRLYDVPVQLGWLPAPLREDELNPTSIFF
jgi:oxazoline/thiazoline synthase